MAMFDEQDEEDDFNGVDLGSREETRSVAAVIEKTLRGTRFIMIFINGSDEEVGLGRLGIPEISDDVIILWTFSARLVTMRTYTDKEQIQNKLRYTDVFLCCSQGPGTFPTSECIPLLHEEAANIIARYPCMRGMDLTRVVDCCLYGLLLTYHSSCSNTTGFAWSAHAPNFWICDRIIQGDRAWEISSVLHPEISFESDFDVIQYMLDELNRDPKTPFLLVHNRFEGGFKERPCRWLFDTTMWDRAEEKVQTTLAGSSSIFLALENKHFPVGSPNGYFKHCTNLGVLVLSCCAFNFLSPPFLHCHTLRFLGLDHCTDDNTVMELEGGGGCRTKWELFLRSMWVIDLYYTDWVDILSEEKIEIMANLMELNIEGVRWPPWTSHHRIQKRLSNLRRLRIIRPTYDEATETEETSDILGDSFLLMDNTRLEILDLSGSNRVLGSISSKASHLQAIVLDGCDGLGDVALPNNSLLRSFSFDGYGPAAASHRASTVELPLEMSRPKQAPADADKKKDGAIKTSIVSLQGCGRLDKLFLRGLPNLVELDLSGCAIKVLDFEGMVVDVPMLKRLLLIGCECLRAIKWGPNVEQVAKKLQMICLDTRPGSGRVLGCARPPSLGVQQKSFPLQVHAIIMDARLIRSLYAPIYLTSKYCYFNIRITSSSAVYSSTTGAVPQPAETASKKTRMVGSSSGHQRQHSCVAGGMQMYSDVFTKVGDGPAPMLAFPQAPTEQSNCHIKIDGGSRSVQSEANAEPSAKDLALLMCYFTGSVHVNDVSTCSSTMPTGDWYHLRWCCVERCRSLHAVFPPGAVDFNGTLETIWASDLLMARCVWSKGKVDHFHNHLKGLRHLHLRRSCPSLRFALAMSRHPSFPSLETLHIIHCGDLKHIFVPNDEKSKHTRSVQFPKLTTIHLHDLPALQQICEGAEALAPALETIKIRGCGSLRRLPALKDRESGMTKPAVEVEKDVWDALEWDGVDAEHHPSLYETPVHSRFHKRRMLRRTVLR